MHHRRRHRRHLVFDIITDNEMTKSLLAQIYYCTTTQSNRF